MITVKGLPLAYNKDLQETQEPLFDSADTLLQMLPLVTGWMKAVEFHHEAHAASCGLGLYECVGGGDVPGEARCAFADWRTSALERRCNCAWSGTVNCRICHWRSCRQLESGFWRRLLSISETWLRCWRSTMFLEVRHRPGCGRRSALPGRKSSLFARRSMRTRKAILPDAEQIHELIAAYSGDGTLLPRTSAGDLRERPRLRRPRTGGPAPSSDAERCTCTARTWPRFARSPSRRGRRAKAAEDGW